MSPLALIAAVLAAYAVALLATLPTRAVVPRGTDAAGTVWHGTATLAGGATARWDASLAQSIAHGAVAADWTIDGPGTLLTGAARWRPGGTELAGVTGRAAWPLLAAAVPGLPAECAITLSVALDRLAAGTAYGSVRSLPGTCPAAGGSVRAIPRLVATFDGTTGRVTPWLDRATTFATIAVAGGVVHLHVTPAGAAVLPGPGRSGDIEFAL